MYRVKTFVCFLYLSILIFPLAAAEGQKDILILNSYHDGFQWSDSILEGMTSTLTKSLPDCALYIEYMDTKRFSSVMDSSYTKALLELYREKFKGYHFDGILCSDDAAFRFLLAFGEELFSDTPAVFCGVNNFDESMLEGKKNFTGVVEITEYQPTIEAALKLQPEAKRVGVITDVSMNGLENRKKFEALASAYAGRLEFVFFDDPPGSSFETLLRRIEGFDRRDFICFSDYYMDGEGNYHEYSDVLPLITKTAPCPVYYHADMYLGYGIIGGKMTSSRMHGELAARMLLSIFAGESPGVFKEPLTRYAFDYSLIKKFGISVSLIPEGSELMNRPLSFLESYGRVMALSLGLLFSLVTIIFILSFNIRMRKRAESKLQEANHDLSVTLDSIGDGVIVTDKGNTVLRINPVASSLTGFSQGEAVGKSLDLVFPIFEADTEKPLENPVREVLKTGKGLSLCNHVLLRNKAGLSFHVANSASPILRREGEAIGAVLVFRDVSEKYAQEKKLKASLKEKEVLLKEIHHRVKNNLQIVSSLLSLQSQQAENELLQAALRESMGRIQTMALIHEHLYRSEDFSGILFDGYVRSLLDSIFIAFGADGEHIQTSLDVGDIRLPIDQAIPVGLIINEIVTNAIKYAFPERREGTIQILMTQEDSRVSLIVRDNGTGLPSRVDLKTAATLGIRLIKALSDQLDGTVDFKNDNGLVCSLSFTSQAPEF